MPTQQRAHGILKAMSRYRSLDALNAESSLPADLMGEGDGYPIGVSLNDDPSAGPVVVADEMILISLYPTKLFNKDEQ